MAANIVCVVSVVSPSQRVGITEAQKCVAQTNAEPNTRAFP